MSTIDLELGTTSPGIPPAAVRRPGGEKRVPEIVYSVGAVLALLIVWFALSHASFIKAGYLPTPEELWATFVDLVKNGYQG